MESYVKIKDVYKLIDDNREELSTKAASDAMAKIKELMPELSCLRSSGASDEIHVYTMQDLHNLMESLVHSKYSLLIEPVYYEFPRENSLKYYKICIYLNGEERSR